ncbi:MAG: hypothetical protein JSV88_10335, partial [Candidatus Aminicenantes bacterium]
KTFLKKGFWTSKNFSLRGILAIFFFAFLRVSSRLTKLDGGFRQPLGILILAKLQAEYKNIAEFSGEHGGILRNERVRIIGVV